MTSTQTRSEDSSETAASGLDRLFGTADHKTIGRAWIGSGLLFLTAGLVLAAVAGLEAVDLGGFSITADADQYTQVWSMGRNLVLVGGVVPILIGLGTYLVPLQVGAPAIAFARGAAGAFWSWLLATGLLVLAYIVNGGPAGGRRDMVVLWVLSMGALLTAQLWALVILATTVFAARTTGMTLDRTPATTWSFLVFSLIGVLGIPVTIAELVLTYVRVEYQILPLDQMASLTGVMESMNLTPGIYWVAIPVLGMLVDVFSVHTGRPTGAHRLVLAVIGAFGFLAYNADFLGFASVRPKQFDHALLVLAIAAAVIPVLVMLGLGVANVRQGKPRFSASLVGALVSLLVLLLGTVASILGLIEPIVLFADSIGASDITGTLVLNGTAFHEGIRGLVIGGTLVGLITALVHWSAKIWGRRVNEAVAFGAVLATAAGALFWGLGGVLAGIDDQTAYPAVALTGGENVEFSNLITLIGLVAVAVGGGLIALEVLRAAVGANKETEGSKNWSGLTLEWATESPPSPGNFATPPVVESATPLADGSWSSEGAVAELTEVAEAEMETA